MNPSENSSATPAATSFTTSRDRLQITQNASYLARRLSDELRGGKRANPNVTRAVAVADHLNARLLDVQQLWPHLQNQKGQPTDRPDALPNNDLPTIIGSASSDARYVQRLTAGGIGMSVNVVEPLRVLGELRRKLDFIQDRWPELQTDHHVSDRPTRDDKILQQLVASGEVTL
ncbi:hypothetical protein [Agrobacterium pusense]|jgi:hypothetical protein|uniref:hypothetical protein n=1 Tax=Agrobacterium pusense TaxID=648995 RepID=UPI00245290AD|nr:hypothetical protein [Agrobacterium pusense]